MKKKKEIRMRAYADVGSHGGIFMFYGGYLGERYPTLLHIYKRKLLKNFVPVTIVYKI